MTDGSSVDRQIVAEGVSRRFGAREIFTRLGFTLSTGDSLAVVGRNGSGKSTLLKILANVTDATSGRVAWRCDGVDLKPDQLPERIGFVAPYLQLYSEFTAWEHTELVQSLRGLPFHAERTEELFESFGLYRRRNDTIKTFSSGMTQRVKFICALLHDPPFLFLDEPSTNLDLSGIDILRQMIASGARSRITIIATNDPDDRQLCNAMISLGE